MDALPERRPQFGNYKVLCNIVNYLLEIHELPSNLSSSYWLQSMDLYEHIHKGWIPRRNARYIEDFQMLFTVAEYIRISIIRHIRGIQEELQMLTSSRDALDTIQRDLVDRITDFDVDSMVWQRFQQAHVTGGEFDWDSSVKRTVEDWIEHMIDTTKLYLRLFYNHVM
jgi:hypothetical protein